MNDLISIIKASGEREPWNPPKLKRSLRAAKASEELAEEITAHIEKDVRDGMHTSDIYAHAFELLKRHDTPAAAQYGLRQAIMQLGPSGFPFERFISKILEHEGFRTQVGVIVPGACVEHEVDVIAEKNDERILVEAKFHNQANIKTDVKVALYVHARFQDVSKRLEMKEGEARFNRAWLITNTHFTAKAVQYGTCAGLAMTGWNYPKGRTFQDLVQITQTHPLTCLTSLSLKQKNQLLEMERVVLCRDILNDTSSLQNIGLNKAHIARVLEEGQRLCPIAPPPSTQSELIPTINTRAEN